MTGKGLATTAILSIYLLATAAHGESHLMRFADVHGDQVVFTYEGDLWRATTAGGPAVRLTNDPGDERFARFSPDGSKIAFTAQYDGGSDVYVMDAGGGVPTRLTWHPADDQVLDWFPDGKSVLFRSRRTYPFRGETIWRVSVDGGMPERLPVDRAGLTALSPDGRSIAYNRLSREFRTWKRYQGGTAQDIWMGSLDRGDFRKITDWPGTDSFPMWWMDAIYFLSDRAHGTLNLYRYDIGSDAVSALTEYRDYDVKYPALGDGRIIYQYAETLHLLDLASGKSAPLDIELPSDLTRMRPTYESAAKNTGSFCLSPTGARMLLESRGEIVNLPVEHGEPIHLTQTSASREKNAAWSPDGRSIAFLSDRTGEEEVYLVDQKGEQPWKQLTTGGLGFRTQPVWSPDSRWLLFHDKFMRLNLVDADSGTLTVIDQGEYDDAWERWGIQDYVWSPDSRWIAYTKMEANLNEAIFLYSLEGRQTHRVTSDWTTDFSPSFDPRGRYLYFLSNRTFDPIMCFQDQNHVFLNMGRPYVLVLNDDGPNPFAPLDSEESDQPADEKKNADEKKADDAEKKSEPKAAAPVEITLADFERRILPVEGVPPGNYFRLEATDNGFLFLKKDAHEFLKYQSVTDTTRDTVDLYSYDITEKNPKKREAKKLIPEVNNYHLSADRKKLLYRSGDTFGVVETGKEAKVGDGKVALDDVRIRVVRPEEFRQIYDEAWRVQRDWFYDPGLHGVDWPAVGEMYRRFVPFCGNRHDLNYLIGEMIGELNAGHTYISGGDLEDDARRVPVGLLGIDIETPPGAAFHRIAHIIPGRNWDERERSPLAAPDCPIREGDYIIAIDGREVPAAENLYRHLEDKAGKVIRLTYNSQPSADGARTHRARTLTSESAIRYREWVENNRAKVEQASGGTISYIHIPDMGQNGLIEFGRAWFPLCNKQGIVIDVRYNGGGFVGDMIIDRIERKLWAITQPREGKPIRDPERTFHGHLAVLINEDTGSNGEYFAEAMKLKGLAPLFGMRTWGGAVGIEPHQRLVDGGQTTPPQFAPYSLDRQWMIEGIGVIPDVEVQNMPGDVLGGRDAQLEAALGYLQEQIARDPRTLPARPDYPRKAK